MNLEASDFKLRQERPGVFFIFSAPSGTGKTTVIRSLESRDSNIYVSVSTTTRAQRANETEGRDYFFATREEFQNKIKNDELLEYEEIYGNFYGTPKKLILDSLSQGKDVICALNFKDKKDIITSINNFSVISIFLLPPDLKVLEQRLRSRGTDSDESIVKRLINAKQEMAMAEYYDYVVINDDLETTIIDVEAIIKTERIKVFSQHDHLGQFIRDL